MTKFAILLIAAVLAPGLHVFVESRDLPLASIDPIFNDEPVVVPEVRPLPLPIVPELRPLPLPVAPEVSRPLPLPVAPEVSRPLPLPVAPEVSRPLPLPVPVTPELRPPVEVEENVVAPELRPLPVVEDACSACFSYMSSLIDQLTETVAVDEPEYIPQASVSRPLPLPVAPVLRPVPVQPVTVPETRPVLVQAVLY